MSTPMRTAVWIAFGAVLSRMLLAQQKQAIRIKHIDVVMLSHLDLGFTDQPYLVVNALQRRYLDVALDASIATANQPPEQRFHWTAESPIPVLESWRKAFLERRQELLRAVRNGQMATGAKKEVRSDIRVESHCKSGSWGSCPELKGKYERMKCNAFHYRRCFA
jgi:hypothetical protein